MKDKLNNGILHGSLTSDSVPAGRQSSGEYPNPNQYIQLRRIESEPPFDVFKVRDTLSGSYATMMCLDSKSKHDNDAKMRLHKRGINSVCAANCDKISQNIVQWNILVCHGHDALFLLTEQPYGRSLSKWHKLHPISDETTALLLIGQLLGALGAVHSVGMLITEKNPSETGQRTSLVHRSVGPDSIRIVECDGKLTLLLDNFENAIPVQIPAGNQFCGTAAFSPRQQLLDARHPHPAWDVWAAAACLYYLLSGRFPREFSGNRWRCLAENKPIPILVRRPDISPGLAAVIDRALDDANGLLYQTAGDLQNALNI